MIASYVNSELCPEAPLPAPVAETVAQLNARLIDMLEHEGEGEEVLAPVPAKTRHGAPSRRFQDGFWGFLMLVGVLLCFAAVAMEF